jgi:hypothetical protein
MSAHICRLWMAGRLAVVNGGDALAGLEAGQLDVSDACLWPGDRRAGADSGASLDGAVPFLTRLAAGPYTSRRDEIVHMLARPANGVGDGNRTRMTSLEGCCHTLDDGFNWPP